MWARAGPRQNCSAKVNGNRGPFGRRPVTVLHQLERDPLRVEHQAVAVHRHAVAGAQDTVARGALLLAAYAFGLGVPFVLAAIAMERFLGFARGFRRHFARLEKAVGALLVVTGVGFLTGGFQVASTWLIETFPTLGQLG